MHYALPHPQRSLAVPLATLALGLAGGVSGALILTDDTVEFRTAAPAAEVSAAPSRSSAVPVPERVAPTPAAPVASSSSPAPVPERVTPGPASQATGNGGSTAPVPERVSGQRPQ